MKGNVADRQHDVTDSERHGMLTNESVRRRHSVGASKSRALVSHTSSGGYIHHHATTSA